MCVACCIEGAERYHNIMYLLFYSWDFIFMNFVTKTAFAKTNVNILILVCKGCS